MMFSDTNEESTLKLNVLQAHIKQLEAESPFWSWKNRGCLSKTLVDR